MISSFLLRHFFVLQAPLADANYHLHGAMDQITPAVPIVAAVDPLPVVPESKFTSEFRYLRQNIGYRKDPPNLEPVCSLQQVFKKIYDKYEIMLMNRQKIDETLRSFKQITRW